MLKKWKYLQFKITENLYMHLWYQVNTEWKPFFYNNFNLNGICIVFYTSFFNLFVLITCNPTSWNKVLTRFTLKQNMVIQTSTIPLSNY